MTECYAQTNLQLYAQLRRDGYVEDQLRMIRNAYDLAVALFTSSFRGSGKPLLSHLVGTASILASIKQAPLVVTAGLLHAAYALGDFGDGRHGMTPWKRERVRNAVGREVEDIVGRYTAFAWDKNAIPAILNRVGALTSDERDVLVIRLANELEDHLDCGVLYCANAEMRREYIRTHLHHSVDMARRLGLAELAEAMHRAFTETLGTELPPTLRHAGDYTYMQPPASHRPRLSVQARHFLDRRPRFARALHPFTSVAARLIRG